MAAGDLDEQGEAAKRSIWDRVASRQAAVALAFQDAVVIATPVDTGNARANWVISIGRPTEVPVSDRTDVSTAAQDRGLAAIVGYRPRNAAQLKVLFVCNAAPYIDRLNKGSSPQAPAEFVERAVDAAVNEVNTVSGDEIKSFVAGRGVSGEIG